jgi:hypothetical protein
LRSDLRSAGLVTITPAVTIESDSTISGDLTGVGGDVTLGGAVNSNNDGENDLIISTGDGAVSVQAIGTGANAALNSVTIATAGTTTLNGSITTTNGIDLSAADDVDLAADLTLTTSAGEIRLDGGAVDGAFDLDVAAGDAQTGRFIWLVIFILIQTAVAMPMWTLADPQAVLC